MHPLVLGFALDWFLLWNHLVVPEQDDIFVMVDGEGSTPACSREVGFDISHPATIQVQGS